LRAVGDSAPERLIWPPVDRKGIIWCMTSFLGGWPVDSATLETKGTDLASAVTGRVSLDAFDTERLLREVDTTAGWRELYDGPATENFAITPGGPLPRVLEFAARGPGWQNLSFLEQDDGTFTCVWSPGPNQVWEE
jgi:hypothetical protein